MCRYWILKDRTREHPERKSEKIKYLLGKVNTHLEDTFGKNR